jgi:hypothetical protein
VGIGTTTPNNALHLGAATNKSIRVDTSSNSAFFGGFLNGATIGINRDPSTGTLVDTAKACAEVSCIGAASDGYIIFSTTASNNTLPTERMRITSAGRVGIGITNPTSFTHVVNNESNSLQTLTTISNVAGDLATAAVVLVKKDNDSSTSQVLMQFLMNGAASGQGQINANGALQAAFGSYSDERLKENIEDLPSQLANIFALRPVEFDYKNGAGHQIGFIAQEVQEIYPDLVGDGADGFLTLSGLGKNEARMIKAFQEFAELTEAKIAALEARVAELEA